MNNLDFELYAAAGGMANIASKVAQAVGHTEGKTSMAAYRAHKVAKEWGFIADALRPAERS